MLLLYFLFDYFKPPPPFLCVELRKTVNCAFAHEGTLSLEISGDHLLKWEDRLVVTGVCRMLASVLSAFFLKYFKKSFF